MTLPKLEPNVSALDHLSIVQHRMLAHIKSLIEPLLYEQLSLRAGKMRESLTQLLAVREERAAINAREQQSLSKRWFRRERLDPHSCN